MLKMVLLSRCVKRLRVHDSRELYMISNLSHEETVSTPRLGDDDSNNQNLQILFTHGQVLDFFDLTLSVRITWRTNLLAPSKFSALFAGAVQ